LQVSPTLSSSAPRVSPRALNVFKSVASTVPPRPRTPIYNLDALMRQEAASFFWSIRLTAGCRGDC